MSWSRSPDRMEKRIRFGCGSLTGCLLLGASLMFFVRTPEMPLWYWIVVPTGAVLAGLLAVRYGDKFYERLASLINQIMG